MTVYLYYNDSSSDRVITVPSKAISRYLGSNTVSGWHISPSPVDQNRKEGAVSSSLPDQIPRWGLRYNPAWLGYQYVLAASSSKACLSFFPTPQLYRASALAEERLLRQLTCPRRVSELKTGNSPLVPTPR